MVSHQMACVRSWEGWRRQAGRAVSFGREREVVLFLSTFVNKVDKKGRVSVPAPFRAALAGQSFAGVVAFPSFVYPAIDASGIDRMEELSRSVDRFNPFSDEHDAFANALFAASHQLGWDGEGRIVLPEKLMRHAGITAMAAFVGRGATFQIWEPEAARANHETARERARRERGALSLQRSDGGGSG